MAIKKAFQPLHEALEALAPNTTVKSILENPAIVKLMTASKGGFSGVDSFVTVAGQKVARICAMTGAVFAHDNTDKDLSFFYKNGSYMIGAEIVKATARKAWEAQIATQAQDLEDEMMDGELDPKAWKEATTALKAEQFEFHLDDEVKATLIADYDGYETKEAFTTAYEAGEVNPFTDYQTITDSLRAEGKEVEAEDEVEAEVA